METIDMIKVMEHFANGGEIIYRVKDDECSSWSTCHNPLWDWFEFEYKIKRDKITIEKWLIKDIDRGEYLIVESSDIDLTLKDYPSRWKVKILETNEVEI